ncbi:nuclear receptor subfamily 5 group A member 2-like [Ambystoma mexicanum]|uniref:nuclear receptor subfamily 5 group A member 2-like n=1 Tax=Ambystoma mexicanum TaxID=8296 RepID=UPI0037E93484
MDGESLQAAVCQLGFSPEMKEASGEDSSERCPICGDRVSGYHYGLLTCESCKGFFKRTVQNNKHYTCLDSQNCAIDKMQRKRCPACRFQKCLSVGMQLEAVRANRMRGGRNKFGPLYRKARDLKKQKEVFVCSSSLVKQETEDHLCLSDRMIPLCCDHQPVSTEHFVASPSGECKRSSITGPPPNMCLAGYPCPSVFQAHDISPFYPVKTEFSDPGACGLMDCLAPSPYSLVSSCAMPPLILELLRCEMAEHQLQSRVLSHLQQEQASRGRHDCLNTFGIMCKMVDQTLFCLVEWARGCIFFKDVQVDDQMRLLQNCWTELLMLDHIYRQVLHGKEGSVLLVTGQQVELSTIISQAGDTLAGLVTRTHELVSKFQGLKVDRPEMVCLKFLVLFSPDVKNLEGLHFVEWVQEQVNRSLMDYTSCHQHQADKFGQLLLRLPEIRAISMQAEDYLFLKHLSGDLPCNNLLNEMLHAKQD